MFSSQIGTKLREWAVGQAGASCYSWAALSSNDQRLNFVLDYECCCCEQPISTQKFFTAISLDAHNNNIRNPAQNSASANDSKTRYYNFALKKSIECYYRQSRVTHPYGKHLPLTLFQQFWKLVGRYCSYLHHMRTYQI